MNDSAFHVYAVMTKQNNEHYETNHLHPAGRRHDDGRSRRTGNGTHGVYQSLEPRLC